MTAAVAENEPGGLIVSKSSANALHCFGNETYNAAEAAVRSLTRSQASIARLTDDVFGIPQEDHSGADVGGRR